MSTLPAPLLDTTVIQGGAPGVAGFNVPTRPISLLPVTVTGTLPNRPTTYTDPVSGGTVGVSGSAQLFRVNVTAAAAVVLTAPLGAPASPTSGWLAGDVVRVLSTALLANTVTVKTVTGAVTLGILPASGLVSYLDIQLSNDGTAWTAIGGGAGV